MPSRLSPDRFPVHDAEITGFAHDAQKAELRLGRRAAFGAQHALVFSGVKAWRLSEFQAQNVLFDVSEYTGSAWLESDEGRDEYYAELNDSITASDAVFLLESSVGLDGAVVAKSWRIDALGSPAFRRLLWRTRFSARLPSSGATPIGCIGRALLGMVIE